MKKLNFWVFVFTVLLVVTGCKKKVEVNFTTDACEISPDGGFATVLLQSNGDWSVTNVTDWITVSPMSGNGDTQILVSADANPLTEFREGSVTVSSKDNETTLKVSQGFTEVIETFLSVTTDMIVAQGIGDTVEFGIICNKQWYLDGVPSWITPSAMEGEGDAILTLYIAPNVEGDVNARTAEISVNAEILSLPVTIVQGNGSIENLFVTPNSLSFDYAETEAKTLVVVTTKEWSVESKPEWVMVDLDHAMQGAEVNVTVEENVELVGRNGVIVFVSGENQFSVSVIQRAAPDPHYLLVSPLSIDFPTEGGEQVINVDCDAEWVINGYSSWFSISQETGSGQGTFTITAEKNDFIGDRTGRVTVTSLGISQVISLHQASGTIQPYLTATPLEIEAPIEGGVYTINVSSNVDWTVRAPQWVEIPVDHGTGDGVVIINVLENTTPEIRTGGVTIRYNDLAVTVVISQQANGSVLPILEVDIENIVYVPTGGTKTVQVTSNQHWTVEGEDWMEFSVQEGENDGSFDITVERNPSTSPRRGLVYVTGEFGTVVKIKISQN